MVSSNSEQEDREHRKFPPHRSVKGGSPRQVTAEASRKMERQRRKTVCEVFYGVWVLNASE